MGASYSLNENIVVSLAWVHAFDNSIQGSILQIPGTSVKLTSQVDSILFGVNMKFGGRRKVAVPEPIPPQPVPLSEPSIPLPPLPTLPGPDDSLTSADAGEARTTALAGDPPPAH